MNTTSVYPAKETAARASNPAAGKQVLVWDAPVRVFHWLMVLCFAGAYITSESETWRLVHVTLGYTMAGLVVFRILWGFVGTRHARFSSFVRGPKAISSYLRSLLRRAPEHNDLAGEWVAELHEVLANGMLLLVGVHIAAVVVSSWLHKENLARAMLTGRKRGSPEQGVRRSWSVLAAILLAAVLGFWYLQWQSAPAAAAPATASAASQHAHGDNN